MRELPLTWDVVESALRQAPRLAESYVGQLNKERAVVFLKKDEGAKAEFYGEHPDLQTENALEKKAIGEAVKEAAEMFVRGAAQRLQRFVSFLLKEDFTAVKPRGMMAQPMDDHFFLIQFDPGDVIMPRGTYSDFAGLLLEGTVRILCSDIVAAPVVPACWERPRPWRHRLERWLRACLAAPASEVEIDLRHAWRRWTTWALRLVFRRLPDDPTGEPTLSRFATSGAVSDIPAATPAVTEHDHFVDRLFGATNALWNQPRSVTLVADPGESDGCLMLVIKRFALLYLFEKNPTLYSEKVSEFARNTLPTLLIENRLFQPRLFVDDIREECWSQIVAGLRANPGADFDRPWKHVRGLLDSDTRGWIDGLDPNSVLDDSSRNRLARALNRAIQRDEFDAPALGQAGDDVRAVAGASVNEKAERNLALFAAAFPHILLDQEDRQPLTRVATQRFLDDLLGRLREVGPLLPVTKTWEPHSEDSADRVVYRQGDPADALYFILRGQLRITRRRAGGEALISLLDRQGFFGESSCEARTKRGSTVEATTRALLIKVPAEILRAATAVHPAVARKLACERKRMLRRDADRARLTRVPTTKVPLNVAPRLLRATNLLVIDMYRCTRCDQCVRTCAEAHGDRPRFHRSNPSFRIGRWEVAQACVHCIDAPCQYACPVGAISFLESGAVQIHRDRCIGCEKCAHHCPYDAIDMYPPTFPGEAPNLLAKKPNVATKCDLCLTPDRDPPCVTSCPYDAAFRGAPADLFPELRGWADYVDIR